MEELKVFLFNSGDHEYVAAYTLEEAKKILLEITCIEDFKGYEISEYPKEKWSSLTIDYPDDSPKWVETLERRMHRVNKPEHICSTVY